MTCKSVCLKTIKKKDLNEYKDYLMKELDAFLVLAEENSFHDIKIMNLVFEKHYIRVHGYVSLTIQFIEHDNEQFVQVIGHVDNIFSFKAVDHFLAKVIPLLNKVGFVE